MLRAVILVLSGALAAEAIVWGLFVPWVSHQFTTGLGPTSELWKPIVALGIIGGAAGLMVFTVLRLFNYAKHRKQ